MLILIPEQVNALLQEVNGVGSTIQNAIKAVNKMALTFSNLSDCFKEISGQLSDITSDSSGEFIHPMLITSNLNNASAAWKQVAVYAEVFTETGLIRNADEDPLPMPAEGQ
jgi:uncharacterized protein YoxC